MTACHLAPACMAAAGTGELPRARAHHVPMTTASISGSSTTSRQLAVAVGIPYCSAAAREEPRLRLHTALSCRGGGGCVQGWAQA